MRLFIVLAVAGLSSCAKLDRTYLPPNAQSSGGGNFLQTPVSGPSNYANSPAQSPNNFGQNSYGRAYTPNQNQGGFGGDTENRPERPRASFERNAAILRQDFDNDGEKYAYAYETENGIQAEENGVATNGVEAQGGFSYTGDDGQVYSIRYTADQNGFVPQGEHIPTPPPVPEEILKALEQNARDEAAGIFDDGKYHDDQNQGGHNSNQYGNGGNGNFVGNGNFNGNGNLNGNGNYNGNSNLANDDSVVINSAAGNQSPGVKGVTNAYLPPRDAPAPQNGFGSKNPSRPGFNSKDGYRY